MRMRFRRVLLFCAGAAAVVVALVGALVLREYGRDPMPLLDQPCAALALREAVTRLETTASGERRRTVELVFDGVPEGPLRATLSLPEAEGPPLPAVLILGGLEVGRDSLRYVETHGPNALVALAYPRPQPDLYDGRLLFKLDAIRRAALAVPAQVAALLGWIHRQPWADSSRVSLLGYSFGAMFVPAAARVAQARAIPLKTLVMAYGGADLPGLLAANSSLRPRWVRSLAARLAGGLIRPLEPALHLPWLKGDALFLTGLEDERVPLLQARLMQSLKPAPKTILELEAGHMDPSRPALNRKIVAASMAWLIGKGALNPVDGPRPPGGSP